MALATTLQTTFAASVMAGFGRICPLLLPAGIMHAFGDSKRPLAVLRSRTSVMRPDFSASVAALSCAPRVAVRGFGQAGVRASVGRAGFATHGCRGTSVAHNRRPCNARGVLVRRYPVIVRA